MSRGFVTITARGKKGRLYLGVSGTLDSGSARRLIWYEEYPSLPQARRRGSKIKGWRRGCKIALIDRLNPDWKDLSGLVA